jgi:hypothetical protein
MPLGLIELAEHRILGFICLMETLDLATDFFSGLNPDEAMIIVRGPWVSMAIFSLSLVAFGHRWRLGTASSDEFIRQSTTAYGLGQCSLAFKAHCKMGPALSSLRSASTNHPNIEMLLGYDDPHAGMETHHFLKGRAIALDKQALLSEGLPSQETIENWKRVDLACQLALERQGPIDSAWFSMSNDAPESALREALSLLAGSTSSDALAWHAWPVSLGDCWSWTRSPWTASPPWTSTPFVGWLDALARMASDGSLAIHDRQAAANKAVVMTDQMALSDLNQAQDAIASILPHILDFNPSPWRNALSKSGRSEACLVFSRAMADKKNNVKELFSADDLVVLASHQPSHAHNLLLFAPWGYSVDELEWLSSHSPAEFVPYFERAFLDVKTSEGSQDKSGKGRL